MSDPQTLVNTSLKDFPSFTDIGRALIADAEGDLHKDTLSRIDARREQLKKHTRQGVSPDEMREATEELTALDAAHRIVDTFWRVVHFQPIQRSA